MGKVGPAKKDGPCSDVTERKLLVTGRLEEWEEGSGIYVYLQNGLSTDALSCPAPVCGLGCVGDGQTLEGVRLEGSCDVAHGLHHGELPDCLSLCGNTGGTNGGTSNDGRHFLVGWLIGCLVVWFIWLCVVCAT